MKNFLDRYTAELALCMRNFDARQFEKAAGILTEAYKKDRQIFIAGNGGSAGTANHFVCDFGKNAVPWKSGKRRFRIISVSDNVEKISAVANDIAFEETFSFQLANLMNNGDVLIAVSASGNSPNIVKACEFAKTRDAPLIALAGFDGGKIKTMADAVLLAPLETYEQIEDIHLIFLHLIVCYFREHPEILE
jgi:D-sedoheptulose 7-phosphate isomerase